MGLCTHGVLRLHCWHCACLRSYKPFDIKERVVAGERPPIAMTMPLAAEKLVASMWHQSAPLRPTFSHVVRELRAVEEALPLGAAALGLDTLDGMPDALDALVQS